MNYYILQDRQPVRVQNHKEWKEWISSANREVQRTELPNGVIVATGFTGQAECIDDSKPPLLFETMVSGGINSGTIQQYATWQQAEEGHAKIVELVSNE